MQPGSRRVAEPVQRVGQPHLEGGLQPQVPGPAGQLDRLAAGVQGLLGPPGVLLHPLRRELQRLGISSEEVVTLEAVMNPQGELVGTQVTEHSPNLSIGSDRLLQQACIQGFFDRNPPRGAEAADGNIHFIIRTRVLALAGPNQMQYGYRVAFQAGLL